MPQCFLMKVNIPQCAHEACRCELGTMLMLIAQMKIKEKVSFWPLSEKPRNGRSKDGSGRERRK